MCISGQLEEDAQKGRESKDAFSIGGSITFSGQLQGKGSQEFLITPSMPQRNEWPVAIQLPHALPENSEIETTFGREF